MPLQLGQVTVEWLGHDSFRIKGAGKVLYIDPFQVEGEPADLILVTHEHYDHCDPDAVNKLKKPDAVIVAPENCAAKLGAIRKAVPNTTIIEKQIDVRVVYAYNINKFREPGKVFHPKGFGVGYIITISGKRIYHAGDTDQIPEMAKLGQIDLALLPVSGTYVMTAEEAAQAARTIRPKVAVPMHYAKVVGTAQDAQKFKELYDGDTIILG
ncbi:MAG: MBL fold metallo-hydrolase [Candidatus Aenigmarchaeota archaeon]|nr:MBL fold metallo-hydrolase [Candidatus Aenigmarchaeota archaeon]